MAERGDITRHLSAMGLLSQMTVPSAANWSLEPKNELLISTLVAGLSAVELRITVRDQSPNLCGCSEERGEPFCSPLHN